jgi:peptidoglycan/LPS O-acetylase OafA/YrhL/Tol biopolymer transport system component
MAQSVALDQWRGVALLLVLVSHGLYFTDRVHGAGRVGVNLFFFISGLLVYRSLAKRGNGGDFWWRRAKRLCPALAAYVALMFPITLLLGDAAGFREAAPAALLFSINYWPAPTPSLAHLWSVACEMQFYALAPLLFLLRRPVVWVALLAVLVGVGVLAPMLDPAGVDKYHFEYAVWPLMLGFCCEHWKTWLAELPGAAWLARAGLVVSAASLALMPLGIQTKSLVIAGGSLSLVPCLFSYLCGRELQGYAGGILTWVGRRTYSIYLWQQPLTICGYLPAALHPLGAAASTLVGGLSYRWFERPFLSAKRQQAPDDSPDATVPAVRAITVGLVVAGALALPATAAAPTGLIVFTRTIGDHEEVFSIRPDGSALKRLTRGGRHEGQPVLSPDGRLIAASSGAAVVIRTRAGRFVRRIRVRAQSEITELSWSPGGRWIAFLAERCQETTGRDVGPLCADLWLVRPDGGARRRLVEANVHTADLIAMYAWSPNGKAIVFERYQPAGLAIVDVSTASARQVPGTRRFGSGDPAWSRSGWIAFARQRGPFRGADLFVVRPNGRGLRRVCRAQNAERPVFSDDGKQLAFLDSRPTGDANRWLVRVRNELGRCRTVGIATEEWTLAWSPDGTRLLWENFIERLVIGWVDKRVPPKLLTRGSFADWG